MLGVNGYQVNNRVVALTHTQHEPANPVFIFMADAMGIVGTAIKAVPYPIGFNRVGYPVGYIRIGMVAVSALLDTDRQLQTAVDIVNQEADLFASVYARDFGVYLAQMGALAVPGRYPDPSVIRDKFGASHDVNPIGDVAIQSFPRSRFEYLNCILWRQFSLIQSHPHTL